MPILSQIFIGDDLVNSKENRLNHVLLGLCMHDGFRGRLLARLGFPEDLVVYKPTNQWGGSRPDFAIDGPDNEPVGYIEIELDRDPSQVARYKQLSDVPVLCIGGPTAPEVDLRLVDVVTLLNEAIEDDPSPQLMATALHFKKQVRDASGFTKSPGPMPLAEQSNSPLGRALYEAGAIDLEPTMNALFCGFYVNTRAAKGLSLRIYSPESRSQNSVSILNISGGRSSVTFNSHAHLKKYLPFEFQRESLELWAQFLSQSFDVDINESTSHVGGSAPLDRVEAQIPEMLSAFFALTWKKDCAESGIHAEENRHGRQTHHPHR